MVVFAAFLLAISAVPVFAAEPPPAPGEIAVPPTPADLDPSKLPDEGDIKAAIEEAERQEAARKVWLDSPAARQEREASRFAFSGLDASSSRALLSSVFAEQLAQLNEDPARVLSDAELLRSGEGFAAIKDEGDDSLLESSLPVRTENEDGELRKVDLSLEETAEGYETENALVELQIPESTEEPIGVGDEGVSIELAGAEEQTAQPYGDENLFASEVLPDTDMLISPIAPGAEIFNILRSEHSPETLRFKIGMPNGAELRADGGWGAEVVKGGQVLTTIPEPVAVDAQGTDVPVDLQVDGSSLLLTVDHREGDYAMPILLDPILENNENWIYGQNHDALDMGLWAFTKNVAGMYGSTGCIYHCFGQPSNVRGLFVSGQSGAYWPNQYAQWSYSAPNADSFITSVTLSPWVRYDHGCNAATTSYKQPHDYFGIWNGSAWVQPPSVNSTNQPGNQWTLPFDGQAVVFGLGSGGSQFSIPCWRDIYAGGAHVWLDDWADPWVNSVSGIPSGWIGEANPINLAANARDVGLGVQFITVTQDGKGVIAQQRPNNCTGTRRSPCPTNHTAQFAFTALSLGEGIRTLYVSAQDPLGKGSGSWTTEVMVDRSEPQVTLEGQLAKATDEAGSQEKAEGQGDELRLPVYNLTVKTTDGNPGGEAKDKRSGMKDIKVFLDGDEMSVPWSGQSCAAPNYSCAMNVVYPLILKDIEAGEHTLKVKAIDQAGNFRERFIEFEYVPATGINDEYLMHYLPLADDEPGEEPRYELAVNVMNGNLVYREKDIEVAGSSVNLEVERFYNSQLPDAESTEWGTGWTLAQTPQLEPEAAPVPVEAELVDSSGVLDEKVDLPTEVGEEEFDPGLQATLTLEGDGGYELTDETGESATSVAFGETGRTEELRTDGYATVDYDYEEGHLSAMAIEDPGTANADPEIFGEGEQVPSLDFLHSTNFGTYGPEDGQLKAPADVATDDEGNLWVLDGGNGRVQKFGPDGQFLAKWGTPGSAEGQLNNPSAIALDAAGNVLVADGFRVQKFSPAGELLLKFGSIGISEGKFLAPTSLAVAGDGSIWVSDSVCIYRYSAQGQFLEQVANSGPGAISWSESIAAGPGGEVFIADPSLDKVKVYDQEGDYLRQFGTSGTGPGQLAKPVEVSVDSEGQVWVADEQTDRVQVFAAEGDYIAGFGGLGEGAEQLDLKAKTGIAVELGRVWVADGGNHRISRWVGTRIADFLHSTNFGTYGPEDGQLKAPADVATDDEGNLWVLDSGNGRVQKLGPDGTFLAKWGTPGTGDGQLNSPSAITLDAAGNILVAENLRVQKFSPAGQPLAKFGSIGSGDGQFLTAPTGVAVAGDGSIWVSNLSKVQRFSASGQFIERVGASGEGQINGAEGLATAPGGEVLAVDPSGDRVMAYNSEGDFLRQFGQSGTAPGQLAAPVEVSVDAEGQVWIADSQTDRIQAFSAEGDYLAGFGGPGEGAEQLDLKAKTGIAVDLGRVWVTDGGNHRIAEWIGGIYEPSEESVLTEDDPQLDVEVSDGLVEAVEGEESGTIEYAHDGDLLTAVDGSRGKTQYEYDSEERLSKVELDNGTWAQISYDSYGRVKSVIVQPVGGTAKTTHFSYSIEPRRTVVSPEGERTVTYDIGEDGSVLKWRNALVPPQLNLAGTLYDNREKDGALIAGDHWLEAQAYSPEGIASIEVIANGNELVDEIHCSQNLEQSGTECEDQLNEWVTETGSHSPGHLVLEAIARDELGQASSERFWVDIPPPPPPLAEGTPVPPKFYEIAKFREEHGLEVVFPVANETELNERIFDLIAAWWNPHTPAGEVARASYERWGVPLRAADVAELEYREWFLEVNGEMIEDWAAGAGAGSFAGFYLDHRSGGRLRVGFTGNQELSLEAMQSALPLVATDRLDVYPQQPTTTFAALGSSADAVADAIEVDPALDGLIVNSYVDDRANVVRVGSANVAQTEAALAAKFGPNAPVAVEYVNASSTLLSGRFRNSGRMRAGDNILNTSKKCTAGYGAYDPIDEKENNEEPLRQFLLTAGHCFLLTSNVHRSPYTDFLHVDEWDFIGELKRDAFHFSQGYTVTDAGAIRIKGTGIIPRGIFGEDGELLQVRPAVTGRIGNEVCFSGATTQNPIVCGHIVGREDGYQAAGSENRTGGYWVRFEKNPQPGDSGGPVWIVGNGGSLGLVSRRSGGKTLVEPLLHPKTMRARSVPGILADDELAPLKLKSSAPLFR